MANENMFVGTAIYKLARKFIKSMIYWASKGFPVVPYYVTWKRRLICKQCTQGVGHRCPTCGCFIVAITKLGTASCKNWDKLMDESVYDLKQDWNNTKIFGFSVEPEIH